MPCLSCQKSSSSPRNFLLNCISCANSWHHRCHSPPVSDNELISIIKAFNAGKHNPAAKLTWKCGICIKPKDNRTRLIAVKNATPQKAIVIDINDDIIALDEVPKRKGTTKLAVSHSSTTQDSLSQLKHKSSTTTSDQSNVPHVHPLPGRTSYTKDKKIRIIDDPFLVSDPSQPSQTSSSSKPQVISGFIDLTISSDEEMNDGDDDALEYLTPPPIPAPTSKQIVEQVPLILTSNQAQPHSLPGAARLTSQMSTMTTPQSPNQLLIQWSNDRSTAAGVKPDLWARACLRRHHVANLPGKQNVQPALSIAPPSRRKCKAHKLNEGSRTHPQITFFLSAEGWLREKQA
ncbi:hypothetical protein BYT27DRAFT_7334731 [Phlegmacium glaucopus]|nr:hypothetical protein BYT27DRAFT_7334731 [Phlegmacium glaucopus]